MADVNTGRKRKSSPQEMIIDLLDDDESSEKVAEIIAERDCKEPVTKCPRKSESPQPNLNEQEDEVILINETEAEARERGDDVVCLADKGEDVISLEGSQNGDEDTLILLPDADVISEGEDVITLNDDVIEQNKDVITQNEDVITLNEDVITQNKDVITLNEDVITQNEDVITLDEDVITLNEDVITQNDENKDDSQNDKDVICLDGSQPEDEELEISQLIVISECSNTEEKIDECDEVKVNPVITIDFANDSIIEKYKVKFLEFIANFTELNAIDENNKISVVVSGNSTDDAIKKRRKDKKRIRAKKELFTLDTCPTVDTEVAPKYNSKFKVVENEGEEEKDDTQCKQQSCFNCEGNHSMRDCPLPKDFNRIRIARQNFRANQSKNSKRYHLELDQLYGHLKPGQISDKLRSALGLHTHDIPSHVYKMRILGYPPGWLEEAKITSSNIAMFDIDGKSVKGKETGKPIDPEKVVGYPGFNVDLEEGCHDENRMYNVPPYSRSQSKEAMISYINKMVESMQDNLETCDMEIDASSDKEVPPGCESETSQEGKDRVSPSLTELEKKKNELLAALTGANPEETPKDPDNKITPDKSNGDVTLENKGDVTLEDADISMEASASAKLVKTSAFGTPILKSCSPFSRLPDADAFMKDVSPVINFENLPNSTGKYEQMTNVLEKVRSTLKNIQDKA